MKSENRKKYEKIVMNSITKENSKWEFETTEHLKGRVTEVYRHYYRRELPGKVHVVTCIEYNVKTNKYQVAYFSRFKRTHHNFRWLGCLSTDDYLFID